MTTQHRPAVAPARTRKLFRTLAFVVLAAGFVAALLPVFHWSLGTAATAMAYLVGTATLITAGTVAVYLAERTSPHGTGLEGEGE